MQGKRASVWARILVEMVEGRPESKNMGRPGVDRRRLIDDLIIVCGCKQWETPDCMQSSSGYTRHMKCHWLWSCCGHVQADEE